MYKVNLMIFRTKQFKGSLLRKKLLEMTSALQQTQKTTFVERFSGDVWVG